MPFSVSMLKTIGVKSIGTSPVWIPSRAMRPPWAIAGSSPRNAAGWPDISSATSKPSVIPSSRWIPSSPSTVGSSVAVAPIFSASSRRYGFGSETTTWRAPAWRTTATAMQPIGPAPVTSTSSPSTGNVRAVWTAFPNGSKIAATSSSTPGHWCQMFVIGSATSSANAPGRCTPRPIEWAQRCRRPAMQLRQRPQTTWPSPLTISPGWKSLTLEPTSTISPTNSCPITSGTGIVFCAHASHEWMCRSVPQMPVLRTRIRTSLIPISGSGTSSSQSPGSAFALTSARTAPPSSCRVGHRRLGEPWADYRKLPASPPGTSRIRRDG